MILGRYARYNPFVGPNLFVCVEGTRIVVNGGSIVLLLQSRDFVNPNLDSTKPASLLLQVDVRTAYMLYAKEDSKNKEYRQSLLLADLQDPNMQPHLRWVIDTTLNFLHRTILAKGNTSTIAVGADEYKVPIPRLIHSADLTPLSHNVITIIDELTDDISGLGQEWQVVHNYCTTGLYADGLVHIVSELSDVDPSTVVKVLRNTSLALVELSTLALLSGASQIKVNVPMLGYMCSTITADGPKITWEMARSIEYSLHSRFNKNMKERTKE